MKVWKISTYLLVAGILSINAGPGFSATKVGVTSAINPTAFGTPPGGVTRRLFLGKNVVFNERIKTSSDGLAQLLFVDGSAFTVGPKSELVIDKFIYDPNKKTGKMVVNVVQGVFRFVGGRLSKKEGGVTIKTSVATIGIRGGIMTGKVGIQGQKSTFSFLFGSEMTVGSGCAGGGLATCSNLKRAFQNGNSIDIGIGGSLNLRRTTKADIAGLNRLLSGTPGKTGGAKNSPTNKTVAKSNIGTSNSANSPKQIAPPAKNAVKSTDVVQVETVLVQPDVAAGDENRDVVIGDPPPPAPGGTQVNTRVLNSGLTYTIPELGNLVINDPGRFGFVGGDDPTDDENIIGTIQNNTILFQETDNGVTTTITVPFVIGFNALQPGDITETFPNGTVTPLNDAGRAFVAPDLSFFLFEVTNFDFGNTDLAVVFGGQKTPAANLIADDSLRNYALVPDFTQNSPVPLSLFNAIPGLANATTTDLLLKVQNGGVIGQYPSATSSRTVMLQGNLVINGQGANQNSYTLLQAATVIDNGNGPDLVYSLRGSFRQAANKGSAALLGRVDALDGAEGNALFGPDGEFFLIGNDPKVKEAASIDFKDGFNSSFDVITDRYATTQLALLKNTVPTANQNVRTSRTLIGFAGGLQESGAPNQLPKIFQSGDDPSIAGEGLEVIFNANRNTMRAQTVLFDVDSLDFVDEYKLTFGEDPTRSGTGRSGFIDDDRFGAQHNRSETSITFDNATTFTYPNPGGVQQNSPNIYFFGNELVPATNFVPGNVNICACKFLEWGYWGGRLRYQDPQASPGQSRRDFFHLGTWVAGNPSTNIPTTGAATFNGHVIGNVAKIVAGQTQQYVAAGNYAQTWDFSTRTGSAQITNFDGNTINAPTLSASTNPGNFSGVINGAFAGKITGTFVSGPQNPVQGVVGKFDVRDPGNPGNFTAQGIIAAERQ